MDGSAFEPLDPDAPRPSVRGQDDRIDQFLDALEEICDVTSSKRIELECSQEAILIFTREEPGLPWTGVVGSLKLKQNDAM